VFLRRGPQQAATVRLWKRKTAAAPAEPIDKEPTTCALESMSALVKSRMAAAVAASGQPIVTDQELHICIQLPHCPTLNLVDLPGLVIAHANPAVPELTRQLAQSAVAEEKDHGIFLLVVEANAQASQSLATKLLQEAQVLDRTLGVFTKADRVSDDVQNDLTKGQVLEQLLSMTSPGSIHLPNGWCCCSIMIPKELASAPVANEAGRETMRLQWGRVKEHYFLHALGLSPAAAKRSGMPRVVQLVQTFYEQSIVQRWIPSIRTVTTKHFDAAAEEQFQLGLPMPNMPAYSGLVAELALVAADAVEHFNAELIATKGAEEHKAVVVMRVNALVADPKQDVFKLLPRKELADLIASLKQIVAVATQAFAKPQAYQATAASVAAVRVQLQNGSAKLVTHLSAACQPKAKDGGLVNLLVTEVFKEAPAPEKSLMGRLKSGVTQFIKGAPSSEQAAVVQLHSKPQLKAGLEKHLTATIVPLQQTFEKKAMQLIEQELAEVAVPAPTWGPEGVTATATFLGPAGSLGDRLFYLFWTDVVESIAPMVAGWKVPADANAEDGSTKDKRLCALRKMLTGAQVLQKLKEMEKAVAAAQSEAKQ
jgi:GTP-binding protein EngB required for normal cell division